MAIFPTQRSWIDDFSSGYGLGSKIGNEMRNNRERNDMEERINAIGQAVDDAGGDFNAIDKELYSDWNGMRAMGEYTKQYLQSQEGMQKVIENNRQGITDQVNWLGTQMDVAKQNQNNPQQFAQIMSQTAKGVNVPWNYRPTEDGMLEEVYIGANGEEPTGKKVTAQELYDTYEPLIRNKPQVAKMLGMATVANAMRNADYKSDPSKQLLAQDPNTGKILHIVPQWMPGENSVGMQRMFTVLEDGKGARPMALEQLAEYGITPQNFEQLAHQQKMELERRKADQSYALDKARIAAIGGGAGGRNGYQMTAGDSKVFSGYATSKDEDGEKQTDYGLTSFLEELALHTGLRPHATIAAFEANIGNAIAASGGKLNREQAKQFVVQAMRERMYAKDKDKKAGKLGGAAPQDVLFPQPNKPQGRTRLEEEIRGAVMGGGTQDSMVLEKGNIDLNNRPIVKNKDGSISTVRSVSFNVDGIEVLVPTVSEDGRIMSNKEAYETYIKTGRHLGKFRNQESATAYAKRLHEDQERLYAQKNNTQDDKKYPDWMYLPGDQLPAYMNEKIKEAERKSTEEDYRRFSGGAWY